MLTQQEIGEAAKKLAGEGYDQLARRATEEPDTKRYLERNFRYGKQQYIDEQWGEFVLTAKLLHKYPALAGLPRVNSEDDGLPEFPDGQWVEWEAVANALLKPEPYSADALLRMFPTAVPKDINVEDREAIRIRVRTEIQAAFKEWVILAPQLYPDFSVGSFSEGEPLHTLSNVLARAAARAYEGK